MTDQTIRPEGAFTYWLLSDQGQAYLNDAERGVINEAAVKNAVAVAKPFGMNNTLCDDIRRTVTLDMASLYWSSEICEKNVLGISTAPSPIHCRRECKNAVSHQIFLALPDVGSVVAPMPGGVGPMTIAFMMKNTLSAARSQQFLHSAQS